MAMPTDGEFRIAPREVIVVGQVMAGDHAPDRNCAATAPVSVVPCVDLVCEGPLSLVPESGGWGSQRRSTVVCPPSRGRTSAGGPRRFGRVSPCPRSRPVSPLGEAVRMTVVLMASAAAVFGLGAIGSWAGAF